MLNRDRPIRIEITVDASQAELLTGLEAWQQLGLLSDESIRHLCQLYLVCPLPEVARAPGPSRTPDFITDASPSGRAAKSGVRPAERSTRVPRVPAASATPTGATRSPGAPGSPVPERQPGPVAQRIQSLVSELSVIWLLFLGVFLVVVSSGVLAASQWRNFSPTGQYLVLLGYTVAFWGAGIWTGRSPNLQLTTRMVQGATVLLIPINIWMMDAIAIWRYPLGIVTAAIASLALLGMLLTLLFAQGRGQSVGSTGARATPALIVGNSLALSLLHWGWGIEGWPLLATYLGTLGTAASLTYYYRRAGAATPRPTSNAAGTASGAAAGIRDGAAARAASGTASGTAAGSTGGIGLGVVTVAIATLLLLARAVLVAGVPIHQLALALGICGWLLCWLSRRSISQTLWRQSGVVLLGLGWVVSVGVTPPWQAIAVSGLGGELLARRMIRDRSRSDLIGLWLVGLQAYLLLWRVIPTDLQTRFVEWVGQQANGDFHPIYLAGPLGFPYVLMTLGLAVYLERTVGHTVERTAAPTAAPTAGQAAAVAQPRQTLAQDGGVLALILGIVLISFSLPCSLTRSLTLTATALMLGVAVAFGRSLPTWLTYLTHSLGLAAIASWINWSKPDLTIESWGLLLLAATMAEWLLAAGLRWSRRAIPQQAARPNAPAAPRLAWSNSAWVLGLVTAGLSYGLLLRDEWLNIGDRQEFWLIVPLALTVLAYLHFFPHRAPAARFSTAALVAVQAFTLNDSYLRLLGLGLGLGLMLFNTRRLHQRVAAFLTVGFGIALTAALIWQGYANQLAVLSSGVILLALAVLVLWILRYNLLRAERPLLKLYGHACNVWAIAIGSLNGLLLTGAAIVGYSDSEFRSSGVATASVLLIGAIAFRIWQQPTNLGFLGMAWGVEVATISVLSLNALGSTVPPLMTLAIANLGLALATQVAGDAWVSQRQQPYRASWHIIPLIYAGLGFVLGHSQMTDTTGLYTLAAALVGMAVGRRLPALQFLTLLSCFGVSLAAYELLLYQLAQAEGGAAGDGFALLTALAAAIALVLQGFGRWLSPYLRLSAVQITGIGHIHWALGIVLLGMAMLNPTTALGQLVTLAVTVALSGYALGHGRVAQRWVYVGFGGLVLAIAYGLYHLPADLAAVRVWAAALACPVAIALYFSPWERWGWTVPPWRQAAIGLPLVVLGMTVLVAGIPTLLVTAGFYAWLANSQGRLRLSYISLGLADWALLRWMFELNVTEPTWYAAIAGLSVLYGVKVDPALQDSSDRNNRHLLRCLALGLISLTALYSAEGNVGMAALTLVYSVVLMFVGFALRGRAYLFVGTATFMITVLRQIWLLVSVYSLLIWAVGIVLGLAFIWVAATFEARRAQVLALAQYWAGELEEWD